mmetsp:Transcript_5018/g.8349  ORF Transcript_5018/g.8349 Transcript_5018/m.8349 type:complete len:296 (-) Transcript_5018:2188-3075(-)
MKYTIPKPMNRVACEKKRLEPCPSAFTFSAAKCTSNSRSNSAMRFFCKPYEYTVRIERTDSLMMLAAEAPMLAFASGAEAPVMTANSMTIPIIMKGSMARKMPATFAEPIEKAKPKEKMTESAKLIVCPRASPVSAGTMKHSSPRSDVSSPAGVRSYQVMSWVMRARYRSRRSSCVTLAFIIPKPYALSCSPNWLRNDEAIMIPHQVAPSYSSFLGFVSKRTVMILVKMMPTIALLTAVKVAPNTPRYSNFLSDGSSKAHTRVLAAASLAAFSLASFFLVSASNLCFSVFGARPQ